MMRKPTSSPAWILIQASLIALAVLLVFPRARAQEPAKTTKDSVRVIVYRQRQNAGYEYPLLIYFDEKQVAWLYKGRYAVLVLPTGPHTFRSTDKKARIEQELKPGEEYYLGLASPERSVRADGRVSVVPREQALEELMDMQPFHPGIGVIKQKQLLAAEQAVPAAAARKQLIDAARDGNAEKVKSLVEGDAELVLVKDPNYGATPLHWAAGSNRKDVVAVLLANKADVNAKNSEGLTALVLAADRGYQEVAELLLANGAEPGFVGIEQIVILPVVDSRSNKKTNVDLQRIRNNAQKMLEHKGYGVVQADSPPPGVRGVLTITVTDLRAAWKEEDLNRAKPGAPVVSLSGSLLDQQSGAVRWQQLGSGSYQSRPRVQGYGAGLQEATANTLTDLIFTSLIPGLARGEALDNAVHDLLWAVPRRPKK